MKSLPEKEFWKTIGSRLRDHAEEPDDVWNQISAGIQSKKINRIDIAGHLFTIIALALLLFIIEVKPNFDVSTSVQGSNAGELKREDKAKMNDETKYEILTKDISKDDGAERQGSGSSRMSATNSQFETSLPLDQNSTESNFLDAFVSIGGTDSLERGIDTNNFSDSPDFIDSPELQTKSALKGTSAINGDSSLAVNQDTTVTVIQDQVNVIEEKPEKKKSLRLSSLYFTVTPTLSYFKIVPEKEDQLVITGIQRDGIISSDRLGYQLEVGFQRSLSPKFDFFAGAQWSSFEQTMSYQYLSGQVARVETVAKLNYTITPATESSTIHHSIKQAGFNTGVFYQLKGGRLAHRAGVGLQFTRSLARYSVEGSDKKSNSNSLNYFLAYRMQYSVSRKVEWFVQPMLSYSLTTNQIDDEPFEIKPYRVGVGIGILYKF